MASKKRPVPEPSIDPLGITNCAVYSEDDVAAAHARGAAEELAAVVVWLRDDIVRLRALATGQGESRIWNMIFALGEACGAIERGEHLREGEGAERVIRTTQCGNCNGAGCPDCHFGEVEVPDAKEGG